MPKTIEELEAIRETMEKYAKRYRILKIVVTLMLVGVACVFYYMHINAIIAKWNLLINDQGFMTLFIVAHVMSVVMYFFCGKIEKRPIKQFAVIEQDFNERMLQKGLKIF